MNNSRSSTSTPPKPKSKSWAELETIIRMAADEQFWTVFSEDPRIIRKLSKKYGSGEAKGVGWLWRVPIRPLSFRAHRIISDAERKTKADRLAAARRGKDRG